MSRWVIEGLCTNKATTVYPTRAEAASGVSPGLPEPSTELAAELVREATSTCPTGALEARDNALGFVDGRCAHCLRCQRAKAPPVSWSSGYEWARRAPDGRIADLTGPLSHSLHIRVVDAGACGACLHEMALLVGPHYNMHRLGFFITPTPRKADVLLVAGPLTDHMRDPLEEAFESMPSPKRVIAAGACAMSGGVFGPSFASGGGVADVLPVDVVVPGCPPPPLALLHALLLVTGRRPPAEEGHDASSERSP